MLGDMHDCGTPTRGRDLHPPLTFQEQFQSDGILCDVNVLFNAMKVTPEEGKAGYSNTGAKVGLRRRSSKLAEAMKVCLTDVLNGFSIEELKNYAAQLILNTCALNGLNDLEYPSANDRDEVLKDQCKSNTINSHPRSENPMSPINPCGSARTNGNRQPGNQSYPFNNIPYNSNPEFPNHGCKKGGMLQTSLQTSGCCSEHSACTNGDDSGRFLTRSDHSSTNKEEANFNRIIRLLDVLCELRPLVEHSSIKNKLEEMGRQFGSKTKDTRAEESGVRSARRKLFQHETSYGNNEFSSTEQDCQPLPTQTPHSLEWTVEDQLRVYDECTDGIGSYGVTPFHPQSYRPQGGDVSQCTPQDLSQYSQSATSDSQNLFARSNINSVIHQRQKTNVSNNRPRRPCSPPSSTVQPQRPPIAKPRKPTTHQSLSSGAKPCPLITPRMTLDNPYLRTNKFL